MSSIEKHLNRYYPVLNDGYVQLIDIMPRYVPDNYTCDYCIVEAARISTNQGLKSPKEDKKLIDYLWSNGHTSPFEMASLKFKLKMPIFVARQLIRHRTAKVNEYSARYSEVQDSFYVPELDEIKPNSTFNKQSSEGELHENIRHSFKYITETRNLTSYKLYDAQISQGISREMARINLPLTTYTEMFWKMDLHNLLKFISLRMHPHAQEQIQRYAKAMYNIIKDLFPWTCESFENHTLNSFKLSNVELEALSTQDFSKLSKNQHAALMKKVDLLKVVLKCL